MDEVNIIDDTSLTDRTRLNLGKNLDIFLYDIKVNVCFFDSKSMEWVLVFRTLTVSVINLTREKVSGM